MQYNTHALHLWQILQTKYMYVLLIKQIITVNICNNKKHIISCKTIETNHYNILLLINIYNNSIISCKKEQETNYYIYIYIIYI